MYVCTSECGGESYISIYPGSDATDWAIASLPTSAATTWTSISSRNIFNSVPILPTSWSGGSAFATGAIGSRASTSYFLDSNPTDSTLPYFYLFGGIYCATTGSYAATNQLWRRNTTSSTWEMLDPARATLSVRLSAMTFYDKQTKSFFVYGGASGLKNIEGRCDMWSYSVAGQTWSQVHNDVDRPFNTAGEGVESSLYSPGCRYGSVQMFDSTNRLFYLVGGIRTYLSGTSIISVTTRDVWRFNPATNNWMFVNVGSPPISYYGVGVYESNTSELLLLSDDVRFNVQTKLWSTTPSVNLTRLTKVASCASSASANYLFAGSFSSTGSTSKFGGWSVS